MPRGRSKILHATTKTLCSQISKKNKWIYKPWIKPRSPALQVDSLPAEPLGKPKNTGVGSLSLLQRIFLTQELKQGLLHCKWILYQLSYRGSPRYIKSHFKKEVWCPVVKSGWKRMGGMVGAERLISECGQGCKGINLALGVRQSGEIKRISLLKLLSFLFIHNSCSLSESGA